MISLEKIQEIADANSTTIKNLSTTLFINLQKMNMLGENARDVKISATLLLRQIEDTRTEDQKVEETKVWNTERETYFASDEFKKELRAPAKKWTKEWMLEQAKVRGMN